MRVSRLPADDVSLVATIDRSEHVGTEYAVVAGQLAERPMAEIPAWDPKGSGPHRVAAQVRFCTALIAGGGLLLR